MVRRFSRTSDREVPLPAYAPRMREADGFEEPGKMGFSISVSDTQAYRQFGNAVVVPVVKAIAAQMKPWIIGRKPSPSSKNESSRLSHDIVDVVDPQPDDVRNKRCAHQTGNAFIRGEPTHWVSASGSMQDSCRATRTLCSPVTGQRYLSMAAFGMGTTAHSSGGLRAGKPSGGRRSVAIAHAMSRPQRHCSSAVGASCRYGSVRFGDGENWEQKKFSNWPHSGLDHQRQLAR